MANHASAGVADFDSHAGPGLLLRRYRLDAGLTQETLAELAHVSVRGLSDLERGLHRAPHAETVRRLADALGLGEPERTALKRAIRDRDTSSPPRPSGLAGSLSSFVGRQRELGELPDILHHTRLLTMTGTGGVGKTRLAVRLAQQVLDEYSDGVHLVELAGLAEPTLLPQAVAQRVGVQELGPQPLLETLAMTLGNRKCLLVLDNCEHLVDAVARLVASLLRGGSSLRILATSREPLRVAGEVVWPVPVLAEGEAVRLFQERAVAVNSSFVLGDDNAEAVAEVCYRLDGLPLAIELAAARAHVLSADEVLARLGDRFSVLVSGDRTAPARHQTLRAVVDWSYDLLDAEERRFFDRLSVFAGSFTLAAAEIVCRLPAALELLSRLVDGSLVLVEPRSEAGESRYHLLDTLRVYGRERLFTRGEEERLQHQHAVWAVELAEQAEAAFHGPEEDKWLRRLEREHDNLRAALAWSIGSGDAELALRLLGSLAWFDGLRGAWTERRGWLERALALPEARAPTRPRASALAAAGMLATFQGDFPNARTWLDEAAALAEQLGDERLVLAARAARVHLLQFGGAIEAADALAEDTLVLARRLGEHWCAGRMLAARAGAALQRGDHAAATAFQEAGVQLSRETGDTWSLAMALSQLGDIQRANQAYVRAGELYAESLALRDRSRLGGTGTPSLWHNLGYIALASGDLTEATARFTQARKEFGRLGERRGVVESIIGLAAVAAAEGRSEAAARLLGAGEAALEALGSQLWPSNRAEYERSLATVRAALDADALEAAWTAGRATRLDDAQP